MKKVYLFLFLAIYAVPISCMEMERKKVEPKTQSFLQPAIQSLPSKTSYPDNINIPLVELKTTSPCSTYQQSQPIILAPSTTNPADIIQAQNLLLEQKLSLVTHISTQTISQKTLHQKILELPGQKVDKLILLVNFMNTDSISVNEMAKYAYDKWVSDKTYPSARAVLTYLYIKNYNQEVSYSNERLPDYEDITKRDNTIGNELAYSLGLKSTKNYSISNGVYDNDSTARNFPAFHRLYTSIRFITIHSPKLEVFTNFIDYIYSNNRLLTYKPVEPTYDLLKKNFYEKAWYVILKEHTWATSDLCYLIHIIDLTKKLNPAKQEYDFGNDFIISQQSNPISLKLGMLCHLIKDYNDQRKIKKNPTPAQHENYRSDIPIFKYGFPDSFDNTLFDTTKYAFKEFSKLIERVLKLKAASDEDVKESLERISFSQK